MNFTKKLLLLYLLIPSTIVLVTGQAFMAINYPLLALYLLCGLYCIMEVLSIKKNNESKSIGFFMLFFLLNAVLCFILNPVDSIIPEYHRLSQSALTTCTSIVFTYFVISYLTQKGYISSKWLFNITMYLFVLAVLAYFINIGQIDYDSETGSSNNVGYRFVIYLPLIFLYRTKGKLFWILYTCSFVLVILSAKRGAIICFGVATLMYLLYGYLRNSTFSKKVMLVFLLGIMFSGVSYMLENNENLQKKLNATEEGHSSGRDVVYATVMDTWLQAPIENKIFGVEYGKTYYMFSFDAHNDWLELSMNQGLVGMSLYLSIFICFLLFYIRNAKHFANNEKMAFLSALFVWFVKSLFSQAYYLNSTIFLIMVLAYITTDIESRKKSRYDLPNT